MPNAIGSPCLSREIMRRRSVLVGAVAVALTGALGIVICFGKVESRPPILSVARVEPAGMSDDSGLEMLLVTLSITGPENPLSRNEKRLFVKDAGVPIEAKVADRWITVEGTFWQRCELWPGLKREMMVAMPAKTVSCRLRFRYTRAILTEMRAAWLARRLPTWMPLYQRLWNWLRKSPYEPSRNWREISIEVPFPLKSARPVNMPDGVHNRRGGVDAGCGAFFAIERTRSGTTHSERSPTRPL